MLLAVYGTLKTGHSNYLLHLPDKRPLHALSTELPYRMYECETYPVILRSSIHHPIYIEIFDVSEDLMVNLDQLEAPYGLQREAVPIADLDLNVDIYVYAEPEPPAGFKPVDTGVWKG